MTIFFYSSLYKDLSDNLTETPIVKNSNVSQIQGPLIYLPPAYVVRQEGNVLTHVCPSIKLSVHGGIPISHNALQHFPECHGADTGGTLPGTASGGGTLPGPARGSTLPGGYPAGGLPWSGTPTPPVRSGWGGTQVGQQKEYSIHGGRYASCVHAGGLSC